MLKLRFVVVFNIFQVGVIPTLLLRKGLLCIIIASEQARNPRNSLEFKGASMKSKLRIALQILFAALVLAALPFAAIAQNDGSSLAAAGLGIGFIFIFLLIFVAFYVYFALALQTIATKTNMPNAWLAWIPIANIFLMLNVAKKPVWWFILFLIPVVNMVINIIVWMSIAEARGKPNWWGILTIVPAVNIVVPGVLAWAD